MTPDKVKEAFDNCAKMIHEAADAQDTDIFDHPWPHDEVPEDETDLLCHALYLCVEGKKLVDENRIEEAMRWLGFVQGVMWSALSLTINDLKDINKPEGA